MDGLSGLGGIPAWAGDESGELGAYPSGITADPAAGGRDAEGRALDDNPWLAHHPANRDAKPRLTGFLNGHLDTPQ